MFRKIFNSPCMYCNKNMQYAINIHNPTFFLKRHERQVLIIAIFVNILLIQLAKGKKKKNIMKNQFVCGFFVCLFFFFPSFTRMRFYTTKRKSIVILEEIRTNMCDICWSKDKLAFTDRPKHNFLTNFVYKKKKKIEKDQLKI